MDVGCHDVAAVADAGAVAFGLFLPSTLDDAMKVFGLPPGDLWGEQIYILLPILGVLARASSNVLQPTQPGGEVVGINRQPN